MAAKRKTLDPQVRLDYLQRARLFGERAAVFRDWLAPVLDDLFSSKWAHLRWAVRRLRIDPRPLKLSGKLGLPPAVLFCHPDILKECPQYADYYRLLGLIPQKGIQRLSLSTMATPKARLAFAQLVNEAISGFIKYHLDRGFQRSDLQSLLFLQLGAQLEGTVRNLIGRRGDILLKQIIIGWLLDSGVALEVSPQSAGACLSRGAKLSDFAELRSICDKAGINFTIAFGTEPDAKVVRRVNGQEEVVAWIEVKRGTDPAGAQERYGAAKKSLEKAANHPDRPRKILLMAIYTDAVLRMIKHDRLVDEHYQLLQMAKPSRERQRFLRSLKLRLGF